MGRLHRALRRAAAPAPRRRPGQARRAAARPLALVAAVAATALVPTTSASFTSTTGSPGSYFEAGALAPPTGLSAVLSCPGGVPSASLSWTPSASAFAAGYHVTRVGGPSFDVAPGTASTATDAGLADKSSYDFTVTSTRSSWASAAATTSLNTDCAPTGATGAYLLAATGGTAGTSLLTTAALGDTNPATNEADVGTGTGVNGLDDVEIEPATGRMLAVGGREVGTLSPTTGLFSRIALVGAGRGADGTHAFSRMTGLAFAGDTGQLWVVEDAGAQGTYLARLDPATGRLVPDAFGAGVDYRVVAPAGVAGRPTDLAINPLTGQLYALLSSDAKGKDTTLVKVNPATGATTVVKALDPYQLDGLDVDGAGQVWAVGVDKGNKAVELLLRLDATTGAVASSAPIDNGDDYRGVAVQTPPAWVGASPLASPASGALALRIPSSALPGDLALAWVGADTTPISAPSGWTAVRSITSPARGPGDISTNGALFWRVVGPSDPNALFTFPAPGSADGSGVIVVYRGARLADPIDAENGVAYDLTTTPTAPGLTTTVTGTRLVALFEHEEPSTVTPAAGMAERLEASNSNYTVEVADEVRVPKGATGARTASASANDDGIAVLVALAPG